MKMKFRVFLGILCLAFVLAACGKQEEKKAEGKKEETKTSFLGDAVIEEDGELSEIGSAEEGWEAARDKALEEATSDGKKAPSDRFDRGKAEEIVRLVNEERQRKGLGALVIAGHLVAAHIAHAFHFGRDVHDMIAAAANLADASATHSLDDLLITDLDGNNGVESDSCCFQGFGLSDGAGHTVQDVAIGTVSFLQTLVDDPDDHVIGHQLTVVDILLGLETHRSTVLHGCAQDVAGRDSRDTKLTLQHFCVGAFTGTWST